MQRLARHFGWLLGAMLLLASCGSSATTTNSGGPSVAAQSNGAACPGQTADAAPQRTFSAAPAMQIDVNKQYTATIATQYGNIVIELLAKQAPKTVNNFVFLACHHFYDGLTFHRIVSDFVIQGGDPQGTGAGGPGYTFADELPPNSSVYQPGALAMANSGPNTNGSQFFICTADDSKQLQPLYSYFGKVSSGMDVVNSIAQVKTAAGPGGENSKPVSPVVMQHVTISVQ